MGSKIILVISLVCLVQISTAKLIFSLGNGINGLNDTITFLDTYIQKDDFGSSITLNEIESTFQHNNGKLKQCYEKFVGEYHKFGQWFTTEIKELGAGFYRDLGSKKKRIAERIKKSLENIANTMAPYPYNLKSFFEGNQIKELKTFMMQAKNDIEHWDVEIFVNIDKYIKGVSNLQAKRKAEEAKQRYREIREKAKKETKTIIKSFQLCVMPRGDN